MDRLTDAIKKRQSRKDLDVIKAGVVVSRAAFDNSVGESLDVPVDLNVRAWGQKIAQEREKLLEVERQLIAQDWEQAVVTSQVTLHKQLLDQLQKQSHQMQQKKTEVTKNQSELQAVHDVSAKRLASLQKCQAVTQELRITRQELNNSTYILKRISESQERLNHEQDRHAQRSRSLQKDLKELQQQLSHALATFDSGATTTLKQKELYHNE